MHAKRRNIERKTGSMIGLPGGNHGIAVLGIVSFYGGVTYPTKRQSPPPIMVADLITECVLSKDNAWRFKSHTLRPVFMSNAPPSMLIAPHFLEQT
jgi:hypothetical protein